MAPPKNGVGGAKRGRWSMKKPSAPPEPKPSKAEALADLLKLAQDNAQRLEDEQTEKDIGMPLEEAKKKYPGVFGSQAIKGAVLENGDELNITVTYTTDSD